MCNIDEKLNHRINGKHDYRDQFMAQSPPPRQGIPLPPVQVRAQVQYSLLYELLLLPAISKVCRYFQLH